MGLVSPGAHRLINLASSVYCPPQPAPQTGNKHKQTHLHGTEGGLRHRVFKHQADRLLQQLSVGHHLQQLAQQALILLRSQLVENTLHGTQRLLVLFLWCVIFGVLFC